MAYAAVFQRVEKKYLLTPAQHAGIIQAMEGRLAADQYGETTVMSLYLDTPDRLLVRRSVDKPRYKEKLRLRSYGVPGDKDTVYLEMKKKVSGIVYKRRMGLAADQAMDFIRQGRVEGDTQIARELDYMFQRYAPQPALWLAYDRVAYGEVAPTPDSLRLTIDRNIRSRDTELDLRQGDAGTLLLEGDMRLMEIKTARAIPLWLCSALDAYQVRPVSFSKYGTVYERKMRTVAKGSVAYENQKGWMKHVYSYG